MLFKLTALRETCDSSSHRQLRFGCLLLLNYKIFPLYVRGSGFGGGIFPRLPPVMKSLESMALHVPGGKLHDSQHNNTYQAEHDGEDRRQPKGHRNGNNHGDVLNKPDRQVKHKAGPVSVENWCHEICDDCKIPDCKDDDRAGGSLCCAERKHEWHGGKNPEDPPQLGDQDKKDIRFLCVHSCSLLLAHFPLREVA